MSSGVVTPVAPKDASVSSPASASSSAAPSTSDPSEFTTVHQEAMQTGKPVEWEPLDEGFCCVCEGRATSDGESWVVRKGLMLTLFLFSFCVVICWSEGDGSEDNPIVFCDSCNMSVHSECYGYPLGQAKRHERPLR